MARFTYELRGHELMFYGFGDGSLHQHNFRFSLAAETFNGRRIIAGYAFVEGEPDRNQDAIDAADGSGTENLEAVIARGRPGSTELIESSRAVNEVIQARAPTRLTAAFDHKSGLVFVTLQARQRGKIKTLRCSLHIEKGRADRNFEAQGVTYGGSLKPTQTWGDPWTFGT